MLNICSTVLPEIHSKQKSFVLKKTSLGLFISAVPQTESVTVSVQLKKHSSRTSRIVFFLLFQINFIFYWRFDSTEASLDV